MRLAKLPAFACGLAAAALVGCAVTRPIPPDSRSLALLRPNCKILVYPRRGGPYQMRYEEIRRDTLFGYTRERNVRQPRADIDSLFLIRISHGRTTAAIFVAAGAALTGILAIGLYAYLHPQGGL